MNKQTVGPKFVALIIVVILVLVSITKTTAQSVTFSPVSVQAWGQLENTMKAEVEYSNFSFVTVGILNPQFDNRTVTTENGQYFVSSQTIGEYSGWYFGLFYIPLEYSYQMITINGGAGFWNRPFPTHDGERFHFTVSASVEITKKLSITYNHMSNGFGLWNKLNPGLDTIGLKLKL